MIQNDVAIFGVDFWGQSKNLIPRQFRFGFFSTAISPG